MTTKMITRMKTAVWVVLAAILCLINAGAAYADTEGGQATENVQITSCEITDDGNVRITAVNTGTISGEDNHFYLKELKPYEDSVRTRGYVQAVDKGNEVTFTFPLNAGTADSRLYSKFVVTVWDGSNYVAVSQPHYQSGKDCKEPESVSRSVKQKRPAD